MAASTPGVVREQVTARRRGCDAVCACNSDRLCPRRVVRPRKARPLTASSGHAWTLRAIGRCGYSLTSSGWTTSSAISSFAWSATAARPVRSNPRRSLDKSAGRCRFGLCSRITQERSGDNSPDTRSGDCLNEQRLLDVSRFLKTRHDRFSIRNLRKFSSQAEPEVLEALQAIADQEGRQLPSVLGEAMREWPASKREPRGATCLRHFRKAWRSVTSCVDRWLNEGVRLYR